jgi:hypothetical protein
VLAIFRVINHCDNFPVQPIRFARNFITCYTIYVLCITECVLEIVVLRRKERCDTA